MLTAYLSFISTFVKFKIIPILFLNEISKIFRHGNFPITREIVLKAIIGKIGKEI